LDGSGMVVVNPPFTLEEKLLRALPALHGLLAEEPAAPWSVRWLTAK
jgi:23S rRNA (adenine2030-N6)-methyltransferase